MNVHQSILYMRKSDNILHPLCDAFLFYFELAASTNLFA